MGNNEEYLEDLSSHNDRLNKLKNLVKLMGPSRPKTFADCITWARLWFQDNFNINIKNLLHQHPLDQVVEGGKSYWTAKKRPPTPEEFSLKDQLHCQFIVAASCLYARLFGIAESKDLADYAAVLDAMEVPEFDPSQAEFVPETDAERKKYEEEKAKKAEEEGEDMDQMCARLLKQVPAVKDLPGTTRVAGPLLLNAQQLL